jgi:hypothetical protein
VNPTSSSASNPEPTIVAVSPSFVVAGSNPQTLKITGTGFTSSSVVAFNGVDQQSIFISPQEIDVSMTALALSKAANYSVTIANPPPGGGSSSTTLFCVWMQYRDTTTNIGIAFPLFGSATQVSTSDVPIGAAASYDIQAWSSSLQAFSSVLGITIYPNLANDGLEQWFEEDIDINGMLLASNTFQSQYFPNGVDALIINGPLPDQYLDTGSPVDQVYAITPDGRFFITMTEGQEAQFSDYGYQPLSLFPQIVGAMSFQ